MTRTLTPSLPPSTPYSPKLLLPHRPSPSKPTEPHSPTRTTTRSASPSTLITKRKRASTAHEFLSHRVNLVPIRPLLPSSFYPPNLDVSTSISLTLGTNSPFFFGLNGYPSFRNRPPFVLMSPFPINTLIPPSSIFSSYFRSSSFCFVRFPCPALPLPPPPSYFNKNLLSCWINPFQRGELSF